MPPGRAARPARWRWRRRAGGRRAGVEDRVAARGDQAGARRVGIVEEEPAAHVQGVDGAVGAADRQPGRERQASRRRPGQRDGQRALDERQFGGATARSEPDVTGAALGDAELQPGGVHGQRQAAVKQAAVVAEREHGQRGQLPAVGGQPHQRDSGQPPVVDRDVRVGDPQQPGPHPLLRRHHGPDADREVGAVGHRRADEQVDPRLKPAVRERERRGQRRPVRRQERYLPVRRVIRRRLGVVDRGGRPQRELESSRPGHESDPGTGKESVSPARTGKSSTSAPEESGPSPPVRTT